MRTAGLFLFIGLFMANALEYASANDEGRLILSWGSNSGWITELRQHSDGSRICTMGKTFSADKPFRISILRAGNVNLLQLADLSPIVGSGELRIFLNNRHVETIRAKQRPQIFSTSEQESVRILRLLSSASSGNLTLRLENNEYVVDLDGLTEALPNLSACEFQANL